ncbi:MAG: ROK family protein [Phycisphaerales bacterium]|nr:ROK family protein [Phycisphaerales bacterium]
MAQGSKAVWVGVDLGGTNIQAGVVSGEGKVLARAKMKTRADEGTEAVIRRVAETVRDAAGDAGVKLKDVHAVGIGAPGTVDIDKGMVVRAVNLRWNRVPLGLH